MAWQRWETFREIAATHTTARVSGADTPGARYCSHTPTPTPNPQRPPTTKPLTPSSPPPPKSSPQTPPQAPGACCESPAVRGLALTLRSAGKVRTVTAAVGHWSSSRYGARALPRTHLRGIPAWGALTYPNSLLDLPTANIFAEFAQMGSGGNFPPLRTGLVCPVKGAP